MKKILLFVSVSAVANISFGMHPDQNYVNNQQNNMSSIEKQGNSTNFGSTNLNKKDSLRRVWDQGIVTKFLQKNDNTSNNNGNQQPDQNYVNNQQSNMNSIEEQGNSTNFGSTNLNKKDSLRRVWDQGIVTKFLQKNDNTSNNNGNQQPGVVKQGSQSKNQQGNEALNEGSLLEIKGIVTENLQQRVGNGEIGNNEDSLNLLGQQREVMEQRQFNRPQEHETLNEELGISQIFNATSELDSNDGALISTEAESEAESTEDVPKKRMWSKVKGLFKFKRKDKRGGNVEERQSLLENQSEVDEVGPSNEIAQNNTKPRLWSRFKLFKSKKKDQRGNQRGVEQVLSADIQNQDENLLEIADVQNKTNVVNRSIALAFLVVGLVVQKTEPAMGVYKAWNTMFKESSDGLLKDVYKVYTEDLAKQTKDLGEFLINSSEVLLGKKDWSGLVPDSLQLLWQGVNELCGNQRKVKEDDKSQENQTENVRNTQVKNVTMRIIAFLNLFFGIVVKDGNPVKACVIAGYKLFFTDDDTLMNRMKNILGSDLVKHSKDLGKLCIGCSDAILGHKTWDQVLTDIKSIMQGIDDMLGQPRLQQEDDKSNDNGISDLLKEETNFSLLVHGLYDLQQDRQDEEQLGEVRRQLINYLIEIGLTAQNIDIILHHLSQDERIFESK